MHCVWCGSRLHKIWRQYWSNVTSVPHSRLPSVPIGFVPQKSHSQAGLATSQCAFAGRADLNSVSVQILHCFALLWSNFWKVSSVYTSRRRERRCDWSHTGFVNIVHSADILHTDTDTRTQGHRQTQTHKDTCTLYNMRAFAHRLLEEHLHVGHLYHFGSLPFWSTAKDRDCISGQHLLDSKPLIPQSSWTNLQLIGIGMCIVSEDTIQHHANNNNGMF